MSQYVKEVNTYLLSIREGDKSAMTILHDTTYNHLKKFIWGYLKNKSYLDDVLLQTYERAFLYISSFDETRDGYNWLCEIAKNLAYDYNQEVATVDIDLLPSDVIQNTFSDNVEAKIDLELATQELDDTDKKIYDMRFYLQSTLSEIGKELGISKVAVYLRIQKIKKIIKKNYKNG